METVPRRYAIVKINRKMIDASDWLIAYVTHTISNSNNLLKYARRRQKKGLIRIINLDDIIRNEQSSCFELS